MRSFILILVLTLLVTPSPALTQESASVPAPAVIPSPGALGPLYPELHTVYGRAAVRAIPTDPVAHPMLSAGAAAAFPQQVGSGPSASRHLGIGAGIGAAVGAAFGLWVISIADCGGSNCTTERVLGVAGTTLAGAGAGALVGGVVYLLRR